MGCDSTDTPVSPASELTIEGTTSDARLLQAIKTASASLQQAGVSRVKIMDWGPGFGVDILPLGGNRAEVNKALDGIRDDLKAAGYDAHEQAAFRCNGSPREVHVNGPAQAR